MIKKESKNVSRMKRHEKIRRTLSGTNDTPRLCVFRSNSAIYAQLIDDVKGVTLASSSSLELKVKNNMFNIFNKIIKFVIFNYINLLSIKISDLLKIEFFSFKFRILIT